MLYLLSALSVMYILLMYYISLLLLPPDSFVLCYIGFLVLTLWRFDDDFISPSPGKGRYNGQPTLAADHPRYSSGNPSRLIFSETVTKRGPLKSAPPTCR